MSNHTPGPWVVADDNRNPGTMAIVHHTVHGYAAIYPPPWHKTSPYPAEQSANARLIAAAPEMYELLTKIRSHIDSTNCSIFVDWKFSECEAKAIVPEIDALLDKIEGEGA